MIETYLAKGGVVNTTSVNEDFDLDEEINALPLNEVREFIETYNKWFLTNYRAEEFIFQVNEDPYYAKIPPNAALQPGIARNRQLRAYGVKPSTSVNKKGSAMNFSKAAGNSSSNVKKPLMQDVSPGVDNSRRGDKPGFIGQLFKKVKDAASKVKDAAQKKYPLYTTNPITTYKDIKKAIEPKPEFNKLGNQITKVLKNRDNN